MTKNIACFVNANTEMIIYKTLMVMSSFIVHTCANAVNVIILNIELYILKGKMIFFLFINVAIEL